MLAKLFFPLYKFFTAPRTFSSPMTYSEAIQILGGSNRIMERYKDLMKANHPDMGGSKYIASKINEAKDLLVKGNR